jgi:mevalonate kinase
MVEKISSKSSPAIILFGEYFNEVGGPIVAFPAQEFVDAKVEKKKDLEDVEIDNQITKDKYKKSEGKDKIESKIIDEIFANEIDVPKKGYKLTITGNASANTVGYSWALVSSIVKAINQLSVTTWKSEELFNASMKASKLISDDKTHLATAIYGSFVQIDDSNEVKPRPFHPGKALFFVQANPETIVAKHVPADSLKNHVVDIKKIVSKSKNEMKYAGVIELGKLMNQNHLLLAENNLASKETDQIIKISNYEGALGAKISGYEGKVLILCEGDKQQDKVLASLVGKGFKAVKIRVN